MFHFLIVIAFLSTMVESENRWNAGVSEGSSDDGIHNSYYDETLRSSLSKRALHTFDNLGGMGLGKRGMGYGNGGKNEKRQLSRFDTLGGLALGKRTTQMTNNNDKGFQDLSFLDSLGGIGLGEKWMNVKRRDNLHAFDSLAGMGLGK